MNKYIKYIALPLAAMAALASCSEETDAEKDKGSTPVVKYVRDCDPAKGDSLIVAASLGSKLAFIGDNLGDVQQVWFNDQKALLNPTMVTSHAIIVDIPNVIPGEVSDIARFITGNGIEVEYPFKVTVPAPRIEEMNCEYAPIGSTASITGAYFANDPNVPLEVFFNDGELKAEITASTQDKVSFKVPEGAREGAIVVKSIYGETKTPFHYADTRGMMFDFEVDGKTGLGLEKRGWHMHTLESSEFSLSGTYLKLGNGETTIDDNTWDENTFAFEHWSGEWGDPVYYPAVGTRLFDIIDFSKWEDMSLKFELFIPSSNPWQTLAMQLMFSGTDKVTNSGGGVDIYGNTVAAANNSWFNDDSGKAATSWGRALYRPWTGTSAFHTNDEWITVTVPLKEFIYNSVGGKATSSPASPSDFANFEIFVWAGGVQGAPSSPVFYIDNIRAVKN